MSTTRKTILVEGKSLNEVFNISKDFLRYSGFRIKESGNELICTRGLGILTAQQRFILKFNQQDRQNVKIEGEFFVITFYFIKSSLKEKAILGAIPIRKGYKLMQDFIARINGKVIE
jgi:hypothetical protein